MSELENELAKANALLERTDVSLEVHKQAMLTKLTIEHRREVGARQVAEHSAKLQRRQEEYEERKRTHDDRMQTDTEYRRKFESEQANSEFRKKFGVGLKLIDYGRLPH